MIDFMRTDSGTKLCIYKVVFVEVNISNLPYKNLMKGVNGNPVNVYLKRKYDKHS